MLAALLMGITSTAGAQSNTTRSFQIRLDNLERAVIRLGRDYAEPVAVLRQYPLETRLIDAKVLFELENFEGASVVFLDLVDNPAFRANRAYPEALLLLGRSLLAMGNTRAAQRYLTQAAEQPNALVADQARYHLLELALTANDAPALTALAGATGLGATARTRYAVGKAMISLGRYEEALSVMQALLGDQDLGARARYYLAVAHTALDHYGDALSHFETLTKEFGGGGEGGVRDESLLAIGRLRMERGELIASVTAYQRVQRHSPMYEQALYEMAWAYIKAEQYDRALGTIDTLMLTVKDPGLDVEAHTLRGRLNIYLQDYDTAVYSFEKIVDRFAPIRNELERFTRDPANVPRYFEWLLERRTGDAKLTAPLTERTAEWVESAGDMRKVVSLFDEMGQQRSEIVTTTQLAEELERIVKAQSRVELFPDLKEGWQRALVLRNQLVMLSSAILDFQYKLGVGRLVGDERADVEALVEWRARLEERFSKLPMSFEQYETRKAQVDDRFLDLRRQAFLVSQRLKEVRRQLLAIESFVNDKQYKEDTKKFPPEEE